MDDQSRWLGKSLSRGRDCLSPIATEAALSMTAWPVPERGEGLLWPFFGKLHIQNGLRRAGIEDVLSCLRIKFQAHWRALARE